MNENNSEDAIVKPVEILEPHDFEIIFYEFSRIALSSSIALITNHS